MTKKLLTRLEQKLNTQQNEQKPPVLGVLFLLITLLGVLLVLIGLILPILKVWRF